MNGKKKPDRKQAVKAAAIKLFAEKGFQATSTSEVARLADVSEGIIFYHFQTKDGILVSVFEEILDEMLGSLGRILSRAETGWEALMGCLGLTEMLAEQRGQEVLVMLRDMPVSLLDKNSPYRLRILSPLGELAALITSAIRMGQRDGSIRDCDPERNAVLIMGLMTGVNRMRLLQVPPVPDVRQEMREFCQRALAPEPDSKPSPNCIRRTESS